FQATHPTIHAQIRDGTDLGRTDICRRSGEQVAKQIRLGSRGSGFSVLHPKHRAHSRSGLLGSTGATAVARRNGPVEFVGFPEQQWLDRRPATKTLGLGGRDGRANGRPQRPRREVRVRANDLARIEDTPGVEYALELAKYWE